MSRPEDHFTNYPEDAAAYEQERGADDDYFRPTRQEIDAEEHAAHLAADEQLEAL